MFDRGTAALIGLRRYRVTGLDDVREQYRRIAADSPVLICAPHVSLWDGWLLHWVFSPSRRLSVVLDPASFSPFFGWCLRRWKGAVVVSQGAGPRGARVARAKCGHRLERGESLLIFPAGTQEEPLSYLAGALAQDFPELPILVVGIRYTPVPVGWGLPSPGATVALTCRTHLTHTPRSGLRGLWDRAQTIAQALDGLPC